MFSAVYLDDIVISTCHLEDARKEKAALHSRLKLYNCTYIQIETVIVVLLDLDHLGGIFRICSDTIYIVKVGLLC